MAKERVTSITIETKLERLGKLKAEQAELKEKVDALVADIKDDMHKKNLTTLKSGEYTATLQAKTSSSFNEEKLLARLKELKLARKCIVKVEKPNEKAIEDLIYNGDLDAAKLSECVESKTTYALMVKGGKKK